MVFFLLEHRMSLEEDVGEEDEEDEEDEEETMTKLAVLGVKGPSPSNGGEIRPAL